MNKEKSCKGCPDRSATCHSQCAGYLKRWDEQRKRNQAEADRYFYNSTKRPIMRRNSV